MRSPEGKPADCSGANGHPPHESTVHVGANDHPLHKLVVCGEPTLRFLVLSPCLLRKETEWIARQDHMHEHTMIA